MAAPLLQAQVDIKAPVSKVWALVSDFRRMPQWSPQCRWMRPLGPVRPGHPHRQPQPPQLHVLADDIDGHRDDSRAEAGVPGQHQQHVWSYELQPIPDGTRVIESRHAENGVKPVSSMAVNALFGGTASFERELIDGMNASLAKIKAAAENS